MASPSRWETGSSGDPRARRRRRRWWIRILLTLIVVAWVGVAVRHHYKSPPPGTNMVTAWQDVPLSRIKLLTDATVTEGSGRVVVRQRVFDEVLKVIAAARQFIVLDWSPLHDAQLPDDAGDGPAHRALAQALAQHLIAARKANQDLRILVIADPASYVPYDSPPDALSQLQAEGIDVITVDLDQLRDSNPVYSALWRLTARWWFGDGSGENASRQERALPDALRRLNFKAAERKLLIADDGHGAAVVVLATADADAARSLDGNVGLALSGVTAQELLASEFDVARASGWDGTWSPELTTPAGGEEETARVRFLSEAAIENELLAAIETTQAGETISIATLHLADRDIANALLAAARRDVRVRLILDPNRIPDSDNDGIPNRPAASELVRLSQGQIEVRWYRTHSERFSSRLALVRHGSSLWAMLGSADLTRRDLDNYNLEASVALEFDSGSRLAQDFNSYYELLWQNDPVGVREYTTDFQTYEDQSFTRYWRYRVMEATGLSAF